MAKNPEPEKLVESDSESGEEDGSSSEEASSQESDSEPELTQITKKPSSSTPAAAKKPQPQSAPKTQQRPSSSLPVVEESESESESDSDGPDSKLRSIATIATTPMDDAQKSTNGARKPRSKPSAADLATPSKSTAVKRPAEGKEAGAKEAKKSKKKAEPETSEKKPTTDDPKKALFQRLWSEEDEIVILKGLIDYSIQKKIDPVADINAFHDFIKKNLHIDVTKTQLQDKIRKLKKKYENNKSKEEKDGKERTFPKPHEQKAYELSKSVWGNENVKENGVEKVVGSPKPSSTALRKAAIKKAYEAKNSANVADNEEPKDAKALDADIESGVRTKRAKLVGATLEERILMIGAELFENGKGGEGENEWNNLRIEEMEVYTRQLEVKAAQARVVIKRLKSSEGN